MNSDYKIQATPVFKVSLNKLTHFLTRKFSATVAKAAKGNIKIKIQNQLSSAPFSAPPSDRLLALGVGDYRQLLVDEHNIVFYRIEENTKTVILLLAIDSRQDLEKLLFEVNLAI